MEVIYQKRRTSEELRCTHIEKVVYSKVIIMIKGFNTQGVDGEDDMEIGE